MSSLETIQLKTAWNKWNLKFQNLITKEPILQELFILLEEQEYPVIPTWISVRKSYYSYYSIEWEDFFVIIMNVENQLNFSITKLNSNEPSVIVDDMKSLFQIISQYSSSI